MTTVTIDIPPTVLLARIEGDVEAADELGRRIHETSARYEDFDEHATAASHVTTW